jgi:hypothetical protein
MDSLNQEYIDLVFANNLSIASFILNSSFVNQHLLIDSLTKLSYLDAVLVNSNTNYGNTTLSLYNAFSSDLVLYTTTYFLPFAGLLSSEYQDPFSTLIIISPELAGMFNDYIYSYILPSSFSTAPVIIFDSYLSN